MDGPGTPPAGAWYVACFSAGLGPKPLARTVAGTPLVLFRDGGGRPVALLDRCPHRNVPLSCGAVRDGLLECCYHGWRFDSSGRCRAVPGLVDAGEVDRRARRAPAYRALEQDGLVWVQPVPGEVPGGGEPYRPPHFDDPTYTTVRRHVRFPAGLHACLENALDVPHTAFLHGGLFRGGREPVEIEVVVGPRADGVEAEYVGEPGPSGLVGRLLAPEGDAVCLRDVLQRLLGDPARRRELGHRGRERVLALYTHARIAEQTVAVYQAAVQQKNHGPPPAA